jgi:hypothetical protein
VALQSNIAALVSYTTGDINGNSINNSNDAYVDNYYTDDEGGVVAKSLFVGTAEDTLSINAVEAYQSAVAAQSNIAAVVAMGGGVYNTSINNSNYATVENYPY